MIKKLNQRQKRNKTRHEFLLTLFPNQKKEYTEIEMNGFHLIRTLNGNTKSWQVSIFSKESYKNYKQNSPHLKGQQAISTLNCVRPG